MTTIGNFTKINDHFVGSLKTLSLSINVEFAPLPATAKGPDYRVFCGDIEFGAAWKKARKDGRSYLSIRLDDPTFAKPIFSTLVEDDDGRHTLIWARRDAN